MIRSFYSWFLVMLIMIFGFTISTKLESQELPAHIKAILDNHKKELRLLLRSFHDQSCVRRGKNVYEAPWLEGYLIKYGIERFYNALELKTIIRRYNLDLLVVPTKYLYHVPGRRKKISSKNYLVIAKKVEQESFEQDQEHQKKGLNLAQTKQLCKVAFLAGHYDLHPGNYLLRGDKVIIIDTDKGAMPALKKMKKFKKDRIVNGLRILNNDGMRMHNDPLAKIEFGICKAHTHYDDEAIAYIKSMAKKRESYFQHKKKCSAFLKFFNLA